MSLTREENKKRLENLKKSIPSKEITFDEIDYSLELLKKQIENKSYIGIYGIPRAGLILAILFSYKTGLPLLASPTKNCLVIDDDIGTGLTIQGYLNKYDTYVMFLPEDKSIQTTYFYQYYNNKIYRYFPWSKNE